MSTFLPSSHSWGLHPAACTMTVLAKVKGILIATSSGHFPDPFSVNSWQCSSLPITPLGTSSSPDLAYWVSGLPPLVSPCSLILLIQLSPIACPLEDWYPSVSCPRLSFLVLHTPRGNFITSKVPGTSQKCWSLSYLFLQPTSLPWTRQSWA